jgi:uncharacterized SAM-binding protein YcdF (DUF218 family)
MSSRPRSRVCNSRLKWLKWLKWLVVGLIGVSTILPIRLAIGLHQAPLPQAIFVLGGDSDRMRFAAQFWHIHPHLAIWISDLAAYETENRQIFQQLNVPDIQVKFDGRATDTVTNFTSLVNVFSGQKLQHLYLITSDAHMRRARAIATIVLGSRGIVITPISVPSRYKPESRGRVVRDCLRSLLWLVTGRSGAMLNPRLTR